MRVIPDTQAIKYGDGNQGFGVGRSATGHIQGTYFASETKDWASVADGATATEEVTVTGAALGDFCLASMDVDLTTGVILEAHVSAADTVDVTLFNESGSPVDLGSGTLSVFVISAS